MGCDQEYALNLKVKADDDADDSEDEKMEDAAA